MDLLRLVAPRLKRVLHQLAPTTLTRQLHQPLRLLPHLTPLHFLLPVLGFARFTLHRLDLLSPKHIHLLRHHHFPFQKRFIQLVGYFDELFVRFHSLLLNLRRPALLQPHIVVHHSIALHILGNLIRVLDCFVAPQAILVPLLHHRNFVQGQRLPSLQNPRLVTAHPPKLDREHSVVTHEFLHHFHPQWQTQFVPPGPKVIQPFRCRSRVVHHLRQPEKLLQLFRHRLIR